MGYAFGSIPSDDPALKRKARYGVLMGGLLSGIASLMIVVGTLSLFVRGPAWLIPIDVVLIAAGVALFARTNGLYRELGRYHPAIVSSAAALRGVWYVLYLRPFETDNVLANVEQLAPVESVVRAVALIGRTEEQQLAALFKKVGRFVGIGLPGEQVSYTGAARLYLEEHDWQGAVRDLMRPARVVVIALGSGRGAMWELCEATRVVEPMRLLLIVPLRRDEYERIRAEATLALSAWAERVPRESGERWSAPRLPDYEEASLNAQIRGVIHFSSEWEPTYTALKDNGFSYAALRGSLLFATRPFFAQLNAYEIRTRWAELHPEVPDS